MIPEAVSQIFSEDMYLLSVRGCGLEQVHQLVLNRDPPSLVIVSDANGRRQRFSYVCKSITISFYLPNQQQITRHVAQIIRREEFLMKLTRAMMMFGGPSHRLQAQIQSAARVLDIKLSFMYLPDIVFISFDDDATGTSHIKLIRQASVLDLGKLNDAFALYWKVGLSAF